MSIANSTKRVPITTSTLTESGILVNRTEFITIAQPLAGPFTEMQKVIEAKDNELAKANAQIHSLTQALRTAESTNNDIAKLLRDRENMLHTQQTTMNAMHAEGQTLVQRVANMQAEIDNLRIENKAVESKNSELDNLNTEIARKYTELRTTSDRLLSVLGQVNGPANELLNLHRP